MCIIMYIIPWCPCVRDKKNYPQEAGLQGEQFQGSRYQEQPTKK
jgi:hypothetical protein